MTRNERIVALWRIGLSYSDIGRRLKVTRCVVSGVLYRAGERLRIDERLRRQCEGRAKAWETHKRRSKKT